MHWCTSPSTVIVVVYQPLYTILPPLLITIIMIWGVLVHIMTTASWISLVIIILLSLLNVGFFLFSNSSCQFVVEQHAATRGHKIGEHDGFHHEGLRLSDDSQPVHIYCQQFGAIGLWKRQQAQMNEQPSNVVRIVNNIIYTRENTRRRPSSIHT